MNERQGIAEEAARLICEELITDYRQAKLKAAERLGIHRPSALPENALVQAAVLEYQRLFGGEAYRAHLRALRSTAVRVLRVLQSFEPRLAGGAVSGAVSLAHRVQLHAFSDKPEMLEIFVLDLGHRCEQSDRTYRYGGGRDRRVPLVCFEVDEVGVDVAVFEPGEQRQAPLNPVDGLPYRRLDLAAAERLSSETC